MTELRGHIASAEAASAAAEKQLEPDLVAAVRAHGEAVGRHSSARGAAGGGSWVLPPPIDERSALGSR